MALSSIALTTVSGVKQYGSMPDATDNDSLIESLINRVSSLFESFTDRTFVSREFTEYYDGLGYVLFPDHYPITTVSGIWDDTDWMWPSTSLVDSSYYRVVDGNRIVLNDKYLTVYSQNVKIIYTAGYETVPEDIEQACIEEVLHRYIGRTQVDVASKTLEDGTALFTPRSLLPQVIEALKPYKKKDVV